MRELTHAFGGCTLVPGLLGTYMMEYGEVADDNINLLYCDTSIAYATGEGALARYAENLRQTAFDALDEEAVLIAVYPVHHASRPML